MATKAEITQKLDELGAEYTPSWSKARLEAVLTKLTSPVDVQPYTDKGIPGHTYVCPEPTCGRTDVRQSSHSALCVVCTDADEDGNLPEPLDTTRR